MPLHTSVNRSLFYISPQDTFLCSSCNYVLPTRANSSQIHPYLLYITCIADFICCHSSTMIWLVVIFQAHCTHKVVCCTAGIHDEEDVDDKKVTYRKQGM